MKGNKIMFCANCGKEIAENVKFCHYCGAEQTATVIPAASIPVVPDLTSVPAAPIEEGAASPAASVPVTPVEENAASPAASVPVAPIEESAASPATSVPAAPVEESAANSIASVPTPNSIPTSNIGETAPAIPSYPPVKSKKKKEPRERKYTLGHLVMCLIAAGVMAIAAGVFAGLYFSVI